MFNLALITQLDIVTLNQKFKALQLTIMITLNIHIQQKE